jgi:V-type H+-transporting ATPase subunit H
LQQFTDSQASRKWTDQEILEDLNFLKIELQARFDELTTFDEYASELESGQLSWTPLHRNDEFWRENAGKLFSHDQQLFKVLVRLLSTSNNATVLAVGCHDVCQIAKQVPKAKE